MDALNLISDIKAFNRAITFYYLSLLLIAVTYLLNNQKKNSKQNKITHYYNIKIINNSFNNSAHACVESPYCVSYLYPNRYKVIIMKATGFQIVMCIKNCGCSIKLQCSPHITSVYKNNIDA